MKKTPPATDLGGITRPCAAIGLPGPDHREMITVTVGDYQLDLAHPLDLDADHLGGIRTAVARVLDGVAAPSAPFPTDRHYDNPEQLLGVLSMVTVGIRGPGIPRDLQFLPCNVADASFEMMLRVFSSHPQVTPNTKHAAGRSLTILYSRATAYLLAEWLSAAA